VVDAVFTVNPIAFPITLSVIKIPGILPSDVFHAIGAPNGSEYVDTGYCANVLALADMIIVFDTLSNANDNKNIFVSVAVV
jgi:hypothetical protein